MRDLSISVAMCTFNGGKFLSAQLESIASQNRLPDELIVSDDGSMDDTIQLVKAFAQRSPFPVNLVVNDKNLGSTKNFEQAISLFAIARSLSCRIRMTFGIHTNFQKPLRAPSGGPKTSLAVFSDADVINDMSQLLGYRLWSTFSFDASKQAQFANGRALNVLIKHPVVTGATMAFCKDLFGMMAPIPANLVHDQWISVLMAARGRFDLIPEPLMQYRRHHGQQLGLGPQTLRETLAHARSRNASVYFQDVEKI